MKTPEIELEKTIQHIKTSPFVIAKQQEFDKKYNEKTDNGLFPYPSKKSPAYNAFIKIQDYSQKSEAIKKALKDFLKTDSLNLTFTEQKARNKASKVLEQQLLPFIKETRIPITAIIKTANFYNEYEISYFLEQYQIQHEHDDDIFTI